MTPWYNILKRFQHSQQFLLYDPRMTSYDNALEIAKKKFDMYLDRNVKNWVRVRAEPIHFSQSLMVEDRDLIISSIEKHLGKELPKKLKESMQGGSWRDFLRKCSEQGLGFIVTNDTSSWKEDLPELWYSLATEQNGWSNVIFLGALPYNYFHYNQLMNNKVGCYIIDNNGETRWWSQARDTKMTKKLREQYPDIASYHEGGHNTTLRDAIADIMSQGFAEEEEPRRLWEIERDRDFEARYKKRDEDRKAKEKADKEKREAVQRKRELQRKGKQNNYEWRGK